jgi:Transglutaminase-like superfamily
MDRDARWMFVRAALLLPAISFSLWIRGFRFTQAALQRFASGETESASRCSLGALSSTSAKHKAQSAARMVRAVARRSPINLTCLEESLALWFLLRREGVSAELRIGARKMSGKFEAHAWVECQGQALNETEDPHCAYAIFDGVTTSLMEAR